MGTQRRRSTRGALAAGICLLLCAGALVEWRRSQSNFSTLRWGGFAVMSAEGKICVLHSNTPTTGPDRSGFHTVAVDRANKDAVIIQWPNFGYSWPTNPSNNERKLTVVAPLWFVAALCALPPLWWQTRGRHQARVADQMD